MSHSLLSARPASPSTVTPSKSWPHRLARGSVLTGVMLAFGACNADTTPLESGLDQASGQPAQSQWRYQSQHSGSQMMHSLEPAEISGTKAIFPQGLFSQSTTIVMEPGESLLGDHQLQQLMANFSPLGQSKSQAVVVRPAAIEPKASGQLTKDFNLEIPVPTPDSLSLTHSLKNLVVIYRAFELGEGRMEVGIIPAHKLRIKGNYVSFKTRKFGSYQAVKLKEPADQHLFAPTDQPVRSLAGKVLIQSGQMSPNALVKIKSL